MTPEAENNLQVPSFQDLMDEMIDAIPVYSDTWTDFNPSDPGITILEALCWAIETLIYKANRLPKQTYLHLLKLIAGTELYLPTDYRQKLMLSTVQYLENGGEYVSTEIIAQTHDYWQSINIAVSTNDYYELSLFAYLTEALIQLEISSADTMDQQKLNIAEYEDSKSIWVAYDAAQEVVNISVNSLFVNPENLEVVQLDGQALVQVITNYLFTRRMVGTVINVALIPFQPVDLHTSIVIDFHYDVAQAHQNIQTEVERFFSPFYGGIDGNGWIPDSELRQSDLIFIISQAEGVRAVKNATYTLTSSLIPGKATETLEGYPKLNTLLLDTLGTTP